MELLFPSPLPRPVADRLDRPPSAASIRGVFGRLSPPRSQETRDCVHVAVGKSQEKTLALLKWTFRRYKCREVVMIHVHQPSPRIPTLMGHMPASQGSEEVVSAYRREEWQDTRKTLLSYQSICYRAQVQGSFIVIEASHIQKGIVDLVTTHGIKTLVVGATSDSCCTGGKSGMTTYIARNAPLFCEVCFVNKGRHVWTREASEGTDTPVSRFSSDVPTSTEKPSPRSLDDHQNESELNEEDFKSAFLGRNIDTLVTDSSVQGSTNWTEAEASTSRNPESFTLPANRHFSSTSRFKLKDVESKAERLKRKAASEIAKRKKLEAEITKACEQIKASEAARLKEARLREELQDQIASVKAQQAELLDQRNKAIREKESAVRDRAVLDGHAQEIARCREEAGRELELIQSSITSIRLERMNARRRGAEAASQFDGCAWSSHLLPPIYNNFLGFGEDSPNFTKFSLSDLQAATCDFSESFKLGHGGSGSVYKGELLNRTVTIRQLHPHNVQGQSEFQQEVYVLSQLRHPHLVSLIGVCAEVLSLVYEYLPNGSLHDHLFRRNANPPLNWNVRTRIAAEISSALLFLHSSKPEKIIHGDLKPENIFLDSDFNCKIGDFGICRLVPEDTENYPLIRRNTGPQGAFPYADPEYLRIGDTEYLKTGELTPKSDIYAFGIIILQLLTGRPPLGLANDVRRAMSTGKLSSVLDQTAGDWPSSVATRLAEFGLQCTEMNGRDRPELTPVLVKELEELHRMEERLVPIVFRCPILQEIMHDPQVAADGFTYESSALLGWVQNGRETSPMTNLELDHLNLTPNHALRFAIQDWLCQS